VCEEIGEGNGEEDVPEDCGWLALISVVTESSRERERGGDKGRAGDGGRTKNQAWAGDIEKASFGCVGSHDSFYRLKEVVDWWCCCQDR